MPSPNTKKLNAERFKLRATDLCFKILTPSYEESLVKQGKLIGWDSAHVSTRKEDRYKAKVLKTFHRRTKARKRTVMKDKKMYPWWIMTKASMSDQEA